jgi:hypothetical protein
MIFRQMHIGHEVHKVETDSAAHRDLPQRRESSRRPNVVVLTSLCALPQRAELSVAVGDLRESYPLRSSRANRRERLGLLLTCTHRADRGAPEKRVSKPRRLSRWIVATGALLYIGK